jgi:hypothetical protein
MVLFSEKRYFLTEKILTSNAQQNISVNFHPAVMGFAVVLSNNREAFV